MVSRGARYFYPKGNRGQQQQQQEHDQQPAIDQHIPSESRPARGSSRGRGRGRNISGIRSAASGTGEQFQQDTTDQQASYAGRRGRGISTARGRGQRVGNDKSAQAERHDDKSQVDESRNCWPELCMRHLKLRNHLPDLPCFKISTEVYDAVISKNIKSLHPLKDFKGQLDPKHYVEPLKLLLEIEEAHQAIEMRKFDMIDKRIDVANHCIDFPGLSNGQPSLVPGDIAVVHDGSFDMKEIFYIVTTRGDKIVLNERRVEQKKDILNNPVNISLISSGTQFDTCRRALDKSTEPFIQEVISEKIVEEPVLSPYILPLNFTEEQFNASVARIETNCWLKNLFGTATAHQDTHMQYMVNPRMWPILRGEPFNLSGERPSRFVVDCPGVASVCDKIGYALLQSPSSLRTVILPVVSIDSYEYSLDVDRCNAIREFFHETSHDVVFVSRALVEAAKLTEPMEPTVQPSLRDLFHDGRENLDSRLACRTLKLDISNMERPFFDLDGRLDRLNGPQRQAVLAILESRYRPRPYILFGPPGTGKTHTLVEAVVQIYNRTSHLRILFCANSNTCADQIYEKLERTGMIDINGVERIRAGDRVSGLDFRRIIITTNIKSGSLMSQRSSFDYVFVDEAGHANEPESLIPICSMNPQGGCLVLAGDPKQLGPVVQNHQASDLGLGTSMLERIFMFKVYEKQHAYGRYNRFFITKLLHCYRCDPSILEIPNKLFYDNELIYVNRTPKSLLKILNLKKSVQFRHVNGNANKPEWSTSWRNYQEVEACVDIIVRLYKMGFDAEQIGLITPYKLQSKELVKRLKSVVSANSRLLGQRFPNKSCSRIEKSASDLADDLALLKIGDSTDVVGKTHDAGTTSSYKIVWTDFKRDWLCKIDTVDAFQGNEREVIIVSTVRTGSNGRLDFLNDARRFNVAVSRAKWLVIVVGDKNVISGESYWSEFYARAEKNDLCQWPRIVPGNEEPYSLASRLFKR